MTTYRQVVASFILAWQVTYLRLVWHTLPAMLPSHFGADGLANRYAPRSFAWVLIAVCAALLIFLSVIERFSQAFNLPSPRGKPDRPRQEALGRELLRWMQLEIAVMFAFILWSMVNVAQHKSDGLGVLFLPISIGILALTCAYYIRRMKTRRSHANVLHPGS